MISISYFQDNSLSKLKQVLSLPNIRSKDALRLVALFTIRYSKEVEKNLDQICGSVKGKRVTYTVFRF